VAAVAAVVDMGSCPVAEELVDRERDRQLAVCSREEPAVAVAAVGQDKLSVGAAGEQDRRPLVTGWAVYMAEELAGDLAEVQVDVLCSSLAV